MGNRDDELFALAGETPALRRDRARVIGVAGLPGSGKSTLMRDLVTAGFVMYDDYGEHWDAYTLLAREDIVNDRPLVVSDINFCRDDWRLRIGESLGVSLEWVYFANDPWQCAVNCLYRLMVQLDDRPLMSMLEQIATLSPLYRPPGDSTPIAIADASIRRT